MRFMASIRLGDLLLKAKIISESQLKMALVEQQRWGGKLGEILVRMNIVAEDLLVKALSKQLALPLANLDTVEGIAPHVRDKLPLAVARDVMAVPLLLAEDNKALVVAMAEPQNIRHLDTLRSVTRCRIIPRVAGRDAIGRALSRFYQGEAELSQVAGDSFKLLNSQGLTIDTSADEVDPPLPSTQRRSNSVTAHAASQAAESPHRGTPSYGQLPPAPAGRSPQELLKAIEEAQRKEVAALKGLVETLIEKGVFTRDEYLARVKR